LLYNITSQYEETYLIILNNQSQIMKGILMSKFSDKIRRDFGNGDKKRDSGLTTPKEVKRFDNISYGEHPVWNLLDVYRPKKETGNRLPVIAIVHGGAWVYGDKDVYQYYGMSLAKRGFSVVNFSYRLAPEYKFPTALEDMAAAFNWILKNSDEYLFDTKNIFAVGDSAGAHLLATFCNLLNNKEYKETISHKYPNAKLTVLDDFKFNAIALNCGKYAFKKGLFDPTSSKKLFKDLLTEGGTDEELSLINAQKYVTKGFPPAFVMTCPGDFLRKQSLIINAAFSEKKVEYEYHYYGDKKKILYHVFHCNMKEPMAEICNDDECNFFKKYIK